MTESTPLSRLPEYRCDKCMRGPEQVEFGRDEEGERRTVCKECRERDHMQERMQQVARTQSQDISTLLRTSIRSRISLPQLNELASKLLLKYGGLDEVVTLIHGHIDQMLTNEKAKPKTKLDALRFLVGILKAGMAEHHTEIQITTLTDDQIDSAIDRFLEDRLGTVYPRGITCDPGNGDSVGAQ